ncbi:maleylpyruvate isomerase N-terminal domain-containing protein [Actinoplanes palleronii]|uniref:Mycothiol-dependent maleylpyruvate isomerase metal-binding domain-containing protein n=1 Tax=Actinoplanes palleronii TaxID=113570 RepID=A0ABQ4BP16_9ACTN|nr:maleylpyruvate isomerase N-terminal domain-containing protein [Actinoplanes palleronii]GIE72421.1 hypothetical protein Apa02nite_085290 [Actinoplanes palleronii]
MELFARAWSALRAAVAAVPHDDFGRASGCTGWLVRDLICHLVLDAQDVLITLATPVPAAPTVTAATYWQLLPEPPDGTDPLDALIPRLAAAYQDPGLLAFHFDDVGAAAGRAAALADPRATVGTRGQVLTVADYLTAYTLEATLHHLDLPDAGPPPDETLAAARAALEQIAGRRFPARLSDTDALLLLTGRRIPTAAELPLLDGWAGRVVLG